MRLSVFDLFDREARRRVIPVLLLSALAGGLEAVLVPLVTWGARLPATTAAYWAVVVVFGLALVGGLALRRTASTRAVVMLEERLIEFQNALLTRLRGTSLRSVERYDEIAEAFTRDVETLANLPRMIGGLVFNGAVIAGLSLYLLYTSLTAFVCWVGICAFAGWILRDEIAESFEAAGDFDEVFAEVSLLTDRMLAGAAQLKLDRAVGDDLAADFDALTERMMVERQRRDDAHRDADVKITFVMQAALGAVVFTLASQGDFTLDLILSLAAIVLFAEGPLVDLVNAGQRVIGAESAWRNLVGWRDRLAPEPDAESSREPLRTFESIELQRVEFGYDTEADFRVGPVDLTLRPGELVFVVGGNGSGKTTLVKLLCGLYPPDAGLVRLDGVPVQAVGLDRYRSLFTVVFARHVLFERAYGLDVSDQARVDGLLERFALHGVTDLDGDAFTHLELSSGQARRLAMIVAMLEDRPVFVLDEWAAHQDPELRRDYYEVLLAELRAQGKAVIAVSHDARYFHLADRIIRLTDGRVEAVPVPPAPGG